MRTTLAIVLATTLATSASFPAQAAGRGPANIPRPDPDKIIKARALVNDGKIADATKLLTEMIGAEKDRDKRALERMSLAVIQYGAGNQDAAAEEQFNKAIEDGLRIQDYAYYYLGLLQKKQGNAKGARASLEHVIQSNATKPTETDARYQLANLFLVEKQWKPAIGQLDILRKNVKSDDRYPEVLFNLIRAERRAGSKKNVCKYSRELYAKYPSYAQIAAWGPYLEKNDIDGEKVGCSADGKDLKTRVRRLWLSGDEERAEKELRLLKGETDEDGDSLADNLYANYLIGEGRLDEALKLILKRYDANHNRPGYLLLLAKAASSAGEYQTAVSAYQRAYEIAPRGKNGATALFQAAFTSYQMQDYDGASRRFEQVVKNGRGVSTKMVRDAQWYLAWLRYLRGDYQGSLESLNSISKAPVAKKVARRGKRRARVEVVSSDSNARDRIQYWSAMSLLKLGRTAEALPLFETLVKDPSIGYYAMLAYYRIQAIPNAKIPAGVEQHLGLKRVDPALAPSTAPSEEDVKLAAAAVAEEAKAEIADNAADATASVPGDQSADEDAQETAAQAADELDEVADAAATPSNFKDLGLAQKFERARDLVFVGLEDAARRELREIEKRARSGPDRRLLMAEYANVRNFERSSYLGEVGFGASRLKTGLKGEGRPFWEYAYPRAWEPAVVKASASTTVPEELIWGIMRAESHFRYDAQSPVGALGLMQLMPFTGKKVADLLSIKAFETRTLLEPDVNIKLGSRYLQRLFEKFGGKVPLVAASYNAGPHRVYAWVKNFGSLDMDEFIEHIPYIETRNYVKRVVRNFQIYSLLYHNNSQSLKWIIQPVGVTLNEPFPLKEVW